MPQEISAEFLASITRSGLLSQDQIKQLNEWIEPIKPDATALGREIIRRGWLTGFQLREIFRGRAHELKLGPYLLLDQIGEGGMGRVFKARHTRLHRDDAVKVIRKDKLKNPQTIRRFKQEVQAAAQLSHPNVVLAFDADEIDGNHFIAMEYIDGIDLTRLVREKGPLPVQQACEYIRQAALGLHHAFERGLVHRDVKPSNLLVTKTGQVKVLDLGLALLYDPNPSDDAGRVTLEGFVLGTPDFLAPEQARNPQAVDTRADVYALGGSLYFLLTGHVPYEGVSPTDKLLKHVMEPPPSALRLRPNLPEELDQLIRRSMAKMPEDRPPTPMDLALELQPFCPIATGMAPVMLRRSLFPTPESEAAKNLELFNLPASEAPARVRERHVTRPRTINSWLATFLAVSILLAVFYAIYQYRMVAETPLASEWTNDLGMKFVRIPEGKFSMGSRESETGREADEGPTADVTLEFPYYMAATEVTNLQYAKLMKRTPSRAGVNARSSSDMPVESVTWEEAREFCRRLNDVDTKKRRGWIYRLPTEAEWEYAARAGSTTAFPYGEMLVLVKQGVVRPEKDDPLLQGSMPTPPSMPVNVGKTEPNAFGLYDMCGNVAEWCTDYYERNYPTGPRVNPLGPPSGDQRVVRGGGWDLPAARARSAARRGQMPDARDTGIGFRVVLVPKDK